MVHVMSTTMQNSAATLVTPWPCRYVGPSQQRYGEYFCKVLFDPTLQPPSQITKMLRRIVFSPFDFITLAAAVPELDGVWADDDPQPFLVLYQHGKSVWAGPPETQARFTAKLQGCSYESCASAPVCQA